MCRSPSSKVKEKSVVSVLLLGATKPPFCAAAAPAVAGPASARQPPPPALLLLLLLLLPQPATRTACAGRLAPSAARSSVLGGSRGLVAGHAAWSGMPRMCSACAAVSARAAAWDAPAAVGGAAAPVAVADLRLQNNEKRRTKKRRRVKKRREKKRKEKKRKERGVLVFLSDFCADPQKCVGSFAVVCSASLNCPLSVLVGYRCHHLLLFLLFLLPFFFFFHSSSSPILLLLLLLLLLLSFISTDFLQSCSRTGAAGC